MTERRVAIEVPVLARVEGKGALDLEIRDGRIERLQLRIYEPPRLFEKFLEGRHFSDVPDLVARVCGICPVAYQMSGAQALEDILGLHPTPWIESMRRLFYCGEWIASHSLHIHLLAVPDFFGCENVIELARREPEAVRRGLRLQEAGNAIIELLGGRSVHPVGARVGGFSRAPDMDDAGELLERLKPLAIEAEAMAAWCAALPLPDDSQDFESVALFHPDEYAITRGRIRSDRGLDIGKEGFDRHFSERQVPHSTALQCLHDGQPYLVGPLARLNLNFGRLPEATRELAASLGIAWPSRNVFQSVVARALEIHFALTEAIRLLEAYTPTPMPLLAAEPREGSGFGITEAPRGMLWHRFELDHKGRVRSARMVPPTSQNQARIEEDLRLSLEAFGMDRDDAEIRRRAETVVRNYDPCISCATHFLDLRIDRGE
jgi:sulfhydrogenase subunit alpha